MKRLLILTAVAMLLSSASGCRFWQCLWRGPAYQQCPPAAVAYQAPVACTPSCNPCEAGAMGVTTSMPGPMPSPSP